MVYLRIKILTSKFNISGLASFLHTLISTSESLEGERVVLDIRKLLKLSGRLMSMSTHTGSITSFNDMLLDLVDVIVGHLHSNERYKAALQLKSLCGGLSEETVKYLCHDYKPSYNDALTTVSIGRAYLSSSRTERVNSCYASTRTSMCLLESIARSVQFRESVLLVGETGVGKTACISYLSSITGNKLVSINLSQQTDSSDLLGGFKPVSVSWLIAPLRSTFEKLYKKTFKANNKFLASLQSVIVEKNWKKLADVIIHTVKIVRKTKQGQLSLLSQWEDLESKAFRLKKQLNSPQSNFAFAFIEGSLVEAVRNGWWVLLDEVNLASPEALQCLSGLLEGPNGSFLLTEKVDTKPVERHPNFQLFCCMNPSTDINKRSLPDSLRSRFTEFYVDEMTKRSELQILIGSYLPEEAHPLIDGIINFYRAMRDKAVTELRDSTGRRPHYSLRTLCRALSYAFKNTFKNIRRSIYEGLLLSFYSQLRVEDYQIVASEAKKYLKPSLSSAQPRPLGAKSVPVEGFWVPTGSEVPIVPADYIITASIRNNLKNLARIVSGR
ncbi:PREDICTED: midasin-like [Amphimedon queenslandica]|uniref:AAA+ ATPase domain-containing protein n=1 Tax=Amphimedon queenslandica TaxID=400682 RepID=A0AAN0JGT6_AMPQE|nr:PREDICTED: midasin-like [Amphimedon queenslandica]|eukprot:XP_019856174.1 PREDICTED: midasin-like [Amphimedon queenslandica]